MNATRKSRKLSVESLEARDLKAGNVFVSVDWLGTLQVTGDNVSNSVAIEGVGGNQYRVTGLEGTRVNGIGSGTGLTFNAWANSLNVNLNAGDDKVVVGGAIVNNLFVSGGQGADQATLNGVFVRGITALDMGSDQQTDRDAVTVVSSTFVDSVFFRLGGGDDTAQLMRSNFAKGLNLDGGTGNDLLLENGYTPTIVVNNAPGVESWIAINPLTGQVTRRR